MKIQFYGDVYFFFNETTNCCCSTNFNSLITFFCEQTKFLRLFMLFVINCLDIFDSGKKYHCLLYSTRRETKLKEIFFNSSITIYLICSNNIFHIWILNILHFSPRKYWHKY